MGVFSDVWKTFLSWVNRSLGHVKMVWGLIHRAVVRSTSGMEALCSLMISVTASTMGWKGLFGSAYETKPCSVSVCVENTETRVSWWSAWWKYLCMTLAHSTAQALALSAHTSSRSECVCAWETALSSAVRVSEQMGLQSPWRHSHCRAAEGMILHTSSTVLSTWPYTGRLHYLFTVSLQDIIDGLFFASCKLQ